MPCAGMGGGNMPETPHIPGNWFRDKGFFLPYTLDERKG